MARQTARNDGCGDRKPERLGGWCRVFHRVSVIAWQAGVLAVDPEQVNRD